MNNDIIATVLEEVRAAVLSGTFTSALATRIAELRKPASVAWPKKPSWLEWHNPDNLKPEQVGEGFRLLTTKELDGRFATPKKKPIGFLQGLYTSRKTWGETISWEGADPSCTYRVPASTPYPAWQLPEPPLGRRWHREDFTPDMLPEGYRPLMDGETGEYEIWMGCEWRKGEEEHLPATCFSAHCRTKRPLPAPEPTQAEKDEAAREQALQGYLTSCDGQQDMEIGSEGCGGFRTGWRAALAYARKGAQP